MKSVSRPLLLMVTVLGCGGSRVLPPDFKDVSYGDHPRLTLNFWQIETEHPAPVLVHIHGGGWLSGSKPETMRAQHMPEGAHYCTINYRLASTAKLPTPVLDAARAVQFLRFKSTEWNIDPDRIVLAGGSAGGASSLLLAYMDDRADPNSEDPVARESTRVRGVAAHAAQTTLDPFLIMERIGSAAATHPMIWAPVGAESLDALMDNWDQFKKLSLDYSPVQHVSPDDPPVYLSYTKDAPTPIAEGQGDGIHHAEFGRILREQCIEVGVECHLVTPGGATPSLTRLEFLNRCFHE